MLSESDFENPQKEAEVSGDSELKKWLVEYVGNRIAQDRYVTTEMIVNIFADEFPEFLLVLAEENFMRGYEQALKDIGEKR